MRRTSTGRRSAGCTGAHPDARQCTCTSLSPALLQKENFPEGSHAALGWKYSSDDWPIRVRTRRLLPARQMKFLEIPSRERIVREGGGGGRGEGREGDGSMK